MKSSEEVGVNCESTKGLGSLHTCHNDNIWNDMGVRWLHVCKIFNN